MNLPWVQQIGAVLPWRRTALFCGLTARNTGWMYCCRYHDSAGSFADTQHFRKALGIFDLILHMVEILKHGEMTVGIGFHHSIPVFEMLLDAAELEKCMLLQFFREYGERLVLQTAQHLAALIVISQRFPCGDKIWLDGIPLHEKRRGMRLYRF